MDLSDCCSAMQDAIDREFVANSPIHLLPQGRVMNEIHTEFYLRNVSDGRVSYLGVNYCPFCGQVISKGLWNAEKKK